MSTAGESQPDDLFVKTPLVLMDMVADGGLTRDAAWLLLILARHINRGSGHTRVWPSREKLATAMGLKQARGVDKYLAELEKVGLITITEQWVGGMQKPNIYTVHMPSSTGSALERTAGRTGETQVFAGGKAVRSNAQRCALQRAEGVRSSAHELDVFELDKKPLSPSAPSAPSGSPTRERDSAAPKSNPNPGRAHRALASRGITGDDAEAILTHHADKGPGWWKKVVDNGDLDAVITAARAAIKKASAHSPAAKHCNIHRLTYTTPECPGCRADRIAAPRAERTPT